MSNDYLVPFYKVRAYKGVGLSAMDSLEYKSKRSEFKDKVYNLSNNHDEMIIYI